MSVCEGPLCPNLSLGGTQPLMGAPKGVPRANRATNETRDRLRSRLHEKHMMSDKKVPSVTKGCCEEKTPVKKVLDCNSKPALCCPLQSKKANPKKVDPKGFIDIVSILENENNLYRTEQFEDIDKIMKFIEGKDIEMARKKAAKKARQKQKKEEEKRKREEEELAKKRAEEERLAAEKRLEEERLKELLAKSSQKKNKKSKSNQNVTTRENDGNSKSKKKNKKGKSNEQYEPELLEETIPAMVTIKRIVENNNSPPTVTITLKGSTPDQDKLLYTLVNGHDNRSNSNSQDKTESKKDDSKSSKKKNKNKSEKSENVTSKELKVTLSVDKSFRKELENKNLSRQEAKESQSQNQKKKAQVEVQASLKNSDKKEQIIDIPSLKLPPGITITKVNGPLTNRKPNNVQSEYQNVPVNKSGVIVVDTEKLIQQSIGTKKSKKKKKKGQQQQQQQQQQSANDLPKQNQQNESTMVTLKNPIFHKIQNKLSQPDTSPMLNMNEQATILKGANGMVTIRRPRQISLQNDTAISDYVIHTSNSHNTQTNATNKTYPPPDNKSTLSEERKIIRPPSPRPTNSLNTSPQIDFENNRLCAQNILWGLPGIQITRVNKNNSPTEGEVSDQTADVSIIRTGGFNFDKDDWQYENVFTPKDILEDDLDADERELEAFKRFCQQSIPPKHKEKVAHLNVKDIVLMKKNDITYS